MGLERVDRDGWEKRCVRRLRRLRRFMGREVNSAGLGRGGNADDADLANGRGCDGDEWTTNGREWTQRSLWPQPKRDEDFLQPLNTLNTQKKNLLLSLSVCSVCSVVKTRYG